jgi:copper chaperone
MAKIIELRVYGMTCDDCTRHVSEGLKGADGVNDVSVSLADRKAIVNADDSVKPEELLNLDIFKGKYKAQLRDVKDE